MEDQGLGYLLNNLLAKQLGTSLHSEDPFKMNQYGVMNAGVQQPNVYGPMPMEHAPLNIPLEGSAEDLPLGRLQMPPVQIGDLQFTPNANYSITEGSGIPGLKSKLINSYFGGNINYPFGDTGFSFQGTYGKSRNNLSEQYRDYPSQNYTNSSSQFDTGLRYDKQFEPGGGLSSLFR